MRSIDLVREISRDTAVPTLRYIAGRNAPCPCGSGEKFKRCRRYGHRPPPRLYSHAKLSVGFHTMYGAVVADNVYEYFDDVVLDEKGLRVFGFMKHACCYT